MSLTNEAVVAVLGDQELDDSSVRDRLPPQVTSVYSHLRGTLPRAESLRFAVDVAEALGSRPSDLSLVWPRFALWLLADPTEGVVQFAHADRLEPVRQVIALYERLCAGTAVNHYEWEEAAQEAWGTAGSCVKAWLVAATAWEAVTDARLARTGWDREAEATVTRRQAEKLLELIWAANGQEAPNEG